MKMRFWIIIAVVITAISVFSGCGTATGKAAWHVFKWRAKARIDERLEKRAESIEDRYDLQEEAGE